MLRKFLCLFRAETFWVSVEGLRGGALMRSNKSFRLRRDFDQHPLAACQRLAQRSDEGLTGGDLPGIDAIAFRNRAEIDRRHIEPGHMFRFEEAGKPTQGAICPDGAPACWT